MRNYLPLILVLFLAQSSIAQKLDFTLEEIWSSGKFSPSMMQAIRSTRDGNHYTALKTENSKSFLVKYDFVKGLPGDTLFKSADWKDKLQEQVSDYLLSDDEKQILIETDNEPIYRRSSRANYYVLNLSNKSLIKLSEGGKQMNPRFSPDGKKVAFVRDNNLFIKDLGNNSEKQITTDGRKNEIINGHADWVYEEEFEIIDAYYWSPDSKTIAYYKFDESKVKEYEMPMYGDLYPETNRFKYPKAGEANSIVDIYLFNMENGSSKKVELGDNQDQYIPRIKWDPTSAGLLVFRMNRWQNKVDYLLSDLNGKTRVVYSEESKTYIDIQSDFTFLNGGKSFLFTSARNGFRSIYLNSFDGKQIKQLAPSGFDVTDFYGVDEASSLAYYQAAAKNPMNREVYCVNLKNGNIQKLSEKEGTNGAIFSSNQKYFINVFSDVKTPYEVTLHSANGKQIRVLEDNKQLREKLANYNFSPKKFFSFTTNDKVKLNGWMIKPVNFDSTKKYPVLMFVYGGPGSQTVLNNWDAKTGLWYQFLASKGYIVVSVDNRGTGSRGEEFKNCTYLQLGKYETVDQIESAKYLASLNFIDKDRIGIQGWSFGGYMTSLCMTKGKGLFKTGIAVAPVTHWKFYDSIYTERYLRTPQENKEGYNDNSPINFAKDLNGKFLMIHGTADDNVHFQNSVDFVTSLVKAGKQFETFYYPNKNHSIYGGNTRFHLYSMMSDFIIKNL